MKIEDLNFVDFNTHWLICTQSGELQAVPKDPKWLRWIKTAFQILTFCFYDIYGHVRISRVADRLFKEFVKEKEMGTLNEKAYVKVINDLLCLENRPIRHYRQELKDVKEKLEKLGVDFKQKSKL